VWLYFRFTLSFRDAEEMLAHRAVDVSYETIRAWTLKFGPKIAANLCRRKLPRLPRWHLDEMVCRIGGVRVFLCRAVDDEGEILDLVVQNAHHTRAELKMLKQLLRSQPVEPASIVTDGLAAYSSALRVLGRAAIHRPGRVHESNRAEKSYLPIRRR
jgi:putative transposase